MWRTLGSHIPADSVLSLCGCHAVKMAGYLDYSEEGFLVLQVYKRLGLVMEPKGIGELSDSSAHLNALEEP